MILSHKYKFIFIKGKKVAGTSIEIALSSLCGKNDIITPITPIDELVRIKNGVHCQNFCTDKKILDEYILKLNSYQENIKAPKCEYYNHMSLERVLGLSSLNINDYYYIVAERDPYAKVLSGASFGLYFEEYKKTGIMNVNDIQIRKGIEDYISGGKMSNVYNFDLYCLHLKKPDFILKFESLAEDFNTLLERLGAASSIKLPHVKKSGCFDRTSVNDIFTENQIDAVSKSFKNEFDYFGYSYL